MIILPFSSYRERQTFFRIVTRLKHSSLSDKLLRFRVLICQILTVPPQLRQNELEAELSKFDMLALKNAAVLLDKLECFKRVTTRKNVCRSR